jgi:hypothetical protein
VKNSILRFVEVGLPIAVEEFGYDSQKSKIQFSPYLLLPFSTKISNKKLTLYPDSDRSPLA